MARQEVLVHKTLALLERMRVVRTNRPLVLEAGLIASVALLVVIPWLCAAQDVDVSASIDSIFAQLMDRLGQSEGSMRKRHAIWV